MRKIERAPAIRQPRSETTSLKPNSLVSLACEAFSDESLTDELVSRVLKWRATPDRYIKANRSWIPRWRFAPLIRLEDAFALVEAASKRYKLQMREDATFVAEVQIGKSGGVASGELKSRVITIAVARAMGMEGVE